ncbi:MAG: GNAT family N-acetyltransferase [Chitinophagales bacterium]
MLSELVVMIASTEEDLEQILSLQKENLERHVSSDEAKEQGFVTVVHDMELLGKMNAEEPSIIAKYKGKVVGYCLSMPKTFRMVIPVLVPMFEKIDLLSFEGDELKECNYMIMGQVCVSKDCRGMGVFDKMYAKMQELQSERYEYLVTEIANRNTRSTRAHQRVGFEPLLTYDSGGELWELVIWNWRP